MLAEKRGLQRSTVRDIWLSWLLTLPASMVLAGGLFLVLLRLFSGFAAAP
jgi:PiT family inorganic phosphate transporter